MAVIILPLCKSQTANPQAKNRPPKNGFCFRNNYKFPIILRIIRIIMIILETGLQIAVISRLMAYYSMLSTQKAALLKSLIYWYVEMF